MQNTEQTPAQTTTERTLNEIRTQHDEVFSRLSAHGWDAVGEPRQRGNTTLLSFRHGGTGDELELAEGELPSWLAQFDEAFGRVRHHDNARQSRQRHKHGDACVIATCYGR